MELVRSEAMQRHDLQVIDVEDAALCALAQGWSNCPLLTRISKRHSRRKHVPGFEGIYHSANFAPEECHPC